jgi:hypothetical protein
VPCRTGCRRNAGAEVALQIPGLERPQPAVEDARHRQRLLGRDLARRHGGEGGVEGGDDIARPDALRHVEADRPAARHRRDEAADAEARERAVDEGAVEKRGLALLQRLGEQRRAVLRPRALALGIARAAREEPPIRAAHLHHRLAAPVHDPSPL